MDIETLVKPTVDWTGHTWGARIDSAASLLFLHGYITASQRRKVTDKLDAQYRDGLATGRIAPAGGSAQGDNT